MSKLALNSAHISTFPLPSPSRQPIFLLRSPSCFLAFPSLSRSHSLPYSPPCFLISFDLPVPIILSPSSALSSYLPASLDFPAHTFFLCILSPFSSLFRSPVPLFFSFSFIITFPPFSVLPPTHILPFFHPLVYPLFFHPHTSFFLLSAPSTLSFSFSSLYSSRPLSRLSLSFHTHTLTPLSPLFLLYSPSSRLSFSLFFHIHRPFFRASRCPSLQKQSCRTFLYGTKKRKAAASRFLIATIC